MFKIIVNKRAEGVTIDSIIASDPSSSAGLSDGDKITVIFSQFTNKPPAKLGPVGFVFAFLALIFAVGVWNRTDAFSVAVAVVVVGLLAMVLLPGWYGSGQRGNRVRRCPNNLKQIAMALDNYHDTYGCFPPAYSIDEQGRPMHSWRILILPYLEGPSAYQGYDFNEPWDGPNNRQLAEQIPGVFRCPEATKHGAAADTHYVAIMRGLSHTCCLSSTRP